MKLTGSGFTGAMYHTPIRGLTLAATLHNLGPRISYIDVVQADPIPLNFVLGSAYKIIESDYNDLTIALDIYKPLVSRKVPAYKAILTAWGDEGASEEMEQIDFHAGIEYVYAKSFALRAGYTYDKDGERNAGVIAQDVAEVLPEAVGEYQDYYTLNDAAITGLLVNAIKELRSELRANT